MTGLPVIQLMVRLRGKCSQVQVIHSEKFKFFFKFIDSCLVFSRFINRLCHSIATKRVAYCDIMGAMMRLDGCSNATKWVQAMVGRYGVATKRVLTVRCDETGALRDDGRSAPAWKWLGWPPQERFSPVQARHELLRPCHWREHCDKTGASPTRHRLLPCRSISL